MLSTTPTRQPGEDFRRKVAAHWGVSYAQLEALALGEDLPPSSSRTSSSETPNDTMPPNLARAAAEYSWLHELPHELRVVVREQARQHYAYSGDDLTRAEWQRVLTGLEREALAFLASRHQTTPPPSRQAASPKKRRSN